MATFEVSCVGCSTKFVAKSRNAKWCGPGCKKRAQRKGPAEAVEAAPEVEPPPADEASGLVASVRAELEAAGRVDTFSGQLALQLARRLANPDESGISSLSKELRTVMAAALDGVVRPADGDGEPDEEDDEVARARRQREEARQAAGLA